MISGRCKLCLQQKPLLRKSHIIPDWMYFGLFDDKHKVAMVDIINSTSKRPSTGIYDGGLFCQTCDNEVLGALEHYGKTILYSLDSFRDFFSWENIIDSGGLRSAMLDKVDYIKFKLFLLSLLYRMHLSNHPFFSQVDIGDSHAEFLREKIYANQKVAEDKYEVAIIGIQHEPDLFTNIILTPKKIQRRLNTYYVVLINGLYFMFNVSSTNKLDFIVKSNLRENGEMLIPLLDGDLARLFYDSLTDGTIRRKIS